MAEPLDKLIQSPIGITGNVLQRCCYSGRLIQSMDWHHRKKMVDRPRIGQRLENGKIAKIFCRQLFPQLIKFFLPMWQGMLLEQQIHFSGNAPEQAFG